MESRTEKLTGAAGVTLPREVLDRTALIGPLAAQLEDSRDPRRITHSLPSLLRASVAMITLGWDDQSDGARLHDDRVLAIAANDRAGVGAAEDALVSQATFSRLLDLLNRETNLEALETAPLELAAGRLGAHRRASNWRGSRSTSLGYRRRCMASSRVLRTTGMFVSASAIR